MATKKKQSSKKTSSKNQKRYPGTQFFAKHTIVYAFVFVIGIVLAITLYSTFRAYQDERISQQYKQQLDQIDTEMNTEFTKIVDILGTPTRMQHEKLCQYPSSDGDPGPPRCGPYYTASYHFTDFNESEQFIKKMVDTVEARTDFKPTSFYRSKPVNALNFEQRFDDTYDTKYGIGCSADIVRGSNDYDRPQGVAPRNFYVYFNYDCSKSTPRPIYVEVNK